MFRPARRYTYKELCAMPDLDLEAMLAEIEAEVERRMQRGLTLDLGGDKDVIEILRWILDRRRAGADDEDNNRRIWGEKWKG